MGAQMEMQLLLFVLGFIPGAAPFMPLIERWLPIILKGLPIAIDLMGKGVAKAQAFGQAHPELTDTLRQFAALVEFGDPGRADEITEDDAIAFASPLLGKPWTKTEVDRWLAKPSAVD